MRAVLRFTAYAVVVLAGCGRQAASSKPRPPASLPMPSKPAPSATVWRVVSVHDGDTLRAIDASKAEHKVRLLGVDAPEIGQQCGIVRGRGLRE